LYTPCSYLLLFPLNGYAVLNGYGVVLYDCSYELDGLLLADCNHYVSSMLRQGRFLEQLLIRLDSEPKQVSHKLDHHVKQVPHKLGQHVKS
jgi:hypothetical protein